MFTRKFVAVTLITGLYVAALGAQQTTPQTPPPLPPGTPKNPVAVASTLASTEVAFMGRMIGNRWYPPAGGLAGPAKMRIDYSQPHLRGRTAFGTGGVVKYDEPWRTGANDATQLTTDLDITIGNTLIPAGVYTIYTLPSATGWKLIINKQTRQWGTVYDASMDLARIDMTVRKLTEPLESFSIWLVPDKQNGDVPATGVLRMAWGTTEVSVPWKVGK